MTPARKNGETDGMLSDEGCVIPPELVGVIIKAYAARGGEGTPQDITTGSYRIELMEDRIRELPIESDERKYYETLLTIAHDGYLSRKSVRKRERKLEDRVERDRQNSLGTLDDVITWKNNILRYIPVGGVSLVELTEGMQNGMVTWADISDTIRTGVAVWLGIESIIQIGGRLARNPINTHYDKQSDAVTRWSKRERRKIYKYSQELAELVYKVFITHEYTPDKLTEAEKMSKTEAYMNGRFEHPLLQKRNITKSIDALWKKHKIYK